MIRKWIHAPLIFLLCLVLGCEKRTGEREPTCLGDVSELRLNQIQLLGTHNSYRTKTYQPMFDWVMDLAWLLPPVYNPMEWDYEHVPIDEQFEHYGIRSLELDIYHDPDGGRYYYRRGHQFINETDTSFIPELLQPGMKVMHIPDFDYNTNYYNFTDALQAVKNWSDANPNHLPIMIMVEPKTETIADILWSSGLVHALPFGVNAVDSIDIEIKSVFGNNLDGILTPDMVRGNYANVRDAILTDGWPKLTDCRGKVMFILNSYMTEYLVGHPNLQGRAMFVYSQAGNPNCAVIKHDDPLEYYAQIQEEVRQGYIVRTRADAGTWEARNGDYTRWEYARTSGAHIISTDYYKADPRSTTSTEWSSYFLQFSHHQGALINPVNSPPDFEECKVFD